MMKRLLSKVRVLVLLGAALTLGASPLAFAEKDKDKKPVRPPTKVTQTLSQKVYKQLEVAQKAFEAKDYKGALADMQTLYAGYDKFNDYEKATYWNFMAAVHYAMNDTKNAIESYMNVLRQNNLPEGLRNSALFAQAQIYFISEDYKSTIKVLQYWFKLVPDAQLDAYVLLAQVYYQQQNYKLARDTMLVTLRKAREKGESLRENWLALLRASYYELGDYANSARVLEILAANYGKQTYWLQLSGMYGLMGDQKKQAEIMNAAYAGNMIKSQADQLNLARLYMASDAPYLAVKLMRQGFKSKVIELKADNLQLFAQALGLSKEYDAQIPVLTKLAGMTGESRHYIYLGQAYSQTSKWPEAAEAFRSALKGKDVGDRGSILMQLGTALYNGNKLEEARNTFADAVGSKGGGEGAANWVKFIGAELQRKRQLAGG